MPVLWSEFDLSCMLKLKFRVLWFKRPGSLTNQRGKRSSEQGAAHVESDGNGSGFAHDQYPDAIFTQQFLVESSPTFEPQTSRWWPNTVSSVTYAKPCS
jgi:hypothetical protein